MLAGSTLNHNHAHRHGLELDLTGFKPDNKRAAPRIVPRPVVSRRCLAMHMSPSQPIHPSLYRTLSSSQLCTDFASKRAGRWETRFWPNRYIRGGCRTHAFRGTRGGGGLKNWQRRLYEGVVCAIVCFYPFSVTRPVTTASFFCSVLYLVLYLVLFLAENRIDLTGWLYLETVVEVASCRHRSFSHAVSLPCSQRLA